MSSRYNTSLTHANSPPTGCVLSCIKNQYYSSCTVYTYLFWKYPYFLESVVVLWSPNIHFGCSSSINFSFSLHKPFCPIVLTKDVLVSSLCCVQFSMFAVRYANELSITYSYCYCNCLPSLFLKSWMVYSAHVNKEGFLARPLYYI